MVAAIAAEIAVDSPVVLSLRPERVAIGDGGEGPNRFPAQLLEVIYLGDHCKLRLRVIGSDEFIAKVPAGDAAAGWTRGDSLVVSWRPQACVALPPESKG